LRRGKKFILNTLILTGTSLLLQFVGVSYSVYISKKIGTSAMGIYQLIMSIFFFAITLSISGIGFCTTRMVAEELAHGEKSLKRIMRRCTLYGVSFGTLTFILLLIFGKHIGTVWLRDARTVKSLYALGIMMPFMSLSAVISGYFTAVRRVFKSASSQIMEQILKIMISVYALNFLMPPGLEYACLAIVGGGSIAEILSTIYLYVLYLLETRKYNAVNSKAKSGRHLSRKMFSIAVPIALSSYVRSGLVTMEHIMIPIGLEKSGVNKRLALSEYGIIHGMVMPIIFFPSALLTSFASLLIPEMAECREHNDIEQIRSIITRILKFTLLFSVGIAGIFVFYAEKLGDMIYQNANVGHFILIFAPLVIAMYLDTVVDGMLKGLNEQVASMRYNIIDAFVSVVLVYILLPVMGIWGYVVVIYISELLNMLLSIRRLIMVTSFKLNLMGWLVKPIICVVAAAFLSGFIAGEIASNLGPTAFIIVQMLLTSSFYFMFLIITGSVTRQDFSRMRGIFV